MDDGGRGLRMDAYLAEDRAAGFDLRRAPLLRVALFRTDEREHHLVITHHHLILDGWSLPLILRDVLALYDAHRRGEPAGLAPAPRYRDYVAWLQTRAPEASEAFWREALAGFAAPTLLPLPPGGGQGQGKALLHLSPGGTRALQAR